MFLRDRQWYMMREVLRALHRRDEGFGILPAVDRGPPRGLIDACCDAARYGEDLPDLRQMPPNVVYAARAARLLASQVRDQPFLDRWLDRNHVAANASPEPGLPLEGSRTEEDVRNRILVNLSVLPASEVRELGSVIRGIADLDVRLVG